MWQLPVQRQVRARHHGHDYECGTLSDDGIGDARAVWRVHIPNLEMHSAAEPLVAG